MHPVRQLVTRVTMRLISRNELPHTPRASSVFLRNPITCINPKRCLSTTTRLEDIPKENTEEKEEVKQENKEPSRKPLGKLAGKLKLMFTCKKCDTRNSKTISKLAYEKGLVIVRCDGCKNNHLIADNLGWFSQYKRNVNVERLLAEKGETVRKVLNDDEGYIEAVLRAELNYMEMKNEQSLNEKRSITESNRECDATNSEDASNEDQEKNVAATKT